jgi:prolyl oligopeptidase
MMTAGLRAGTVLAVLLTLGTLPGGNAALAMDSSAPPTVMQPVVNTYHGVAVSDPYRWLEDGSAPRVEAWSAAQNSRTRAYLDHLAVRATLHDRIMAAVSTTSPSYHELTLAAGQLFSLTVQPPKQQPMVTVMPSSADPRAGRIVVDPNTLDPSGQTAIDWFVPSPDGKKVAVSLSRNGSEDGTVHVFDVATGKETGEAVPQAQYPTAGGSLAWKADSSGFWYTRYPGDERPPADRHFFQQVYYHALGTDPAGDRYVLGRNFPKIAEIALDSRQNPNAVLVSVANGDGGEFEHYIIGADGRITEVTHFADQVVAGAIGPDNILYLVSKKNAPRGKILCLPLSDLDLASAKILIPQGEGAIQGGGEFGGVPVVVGRNAIYLRELVGGPSRVAIFSHDGTPKGQIALPPIAAVDELEPAEDGHVLYGVQTYLQPYHVMSYDEDTGASHETRLAETSPVRFGDAEVVRMFATSKDGTRVPVNVIRRKSTKYDGRRPTLLYGYGGYGVSMTPRFAGEATRLWLDAGGVWAIANLRGGGEYGENWHKNGALTHKQNVFDDFLAAGRLLIADHVTSPAHLAILGGSNGGLLMGAALTEAPSMFRAAVSLVGIYDMMRIELDPNGAFNVTEFGTVADPADFKAMLVYSPYQHVRNGVKYPAVFMATGIHDGRVNPAQSRKMIARLQAATTSGLPVYLSISDKAGHGIGSAMSVRVDQQSDYMAFLFNQLGMTLPDTGR